MLKDYETRSSDVAACCRSYCLRRTVLLIVGIDVVRMSICLLTYSFKLDSDFVAKSLLLIPVRFLACSPCFVAKRYIEQQKTIIIVSEEVNIGSAVLYEHDGKTFNPPPCTDSERHNTQCHRQTDRQTVS